MAGDAAASTVQVTTRVVPGTKYEPGRAVATATVSAPGPERNVLEVRQDAQALIVADAVAPVFAGAGCRSIDASSVRCEAPAGFYLSEARAVLGGGDDQARFVTVGVSAAVSGDDGNDVLEVNANELTPFSGPSASVSGGAGDDVLTTGNGADYLSGGTGADRLSSGASNDALIGDPPAGPYAPDVLDGGDSPFDVVDYSDRPGGVLVNLGAADAVAGGTGEGDRIQGVEDVVGGAGGDNLIGDGQRNNLSGGDGNDRLVGLGGADVLQGGRGTDILIGGDDNDVLGVQTAAEDTLEAGRGDDQLTVDTRQPDLPALGSLMRVSCGTGHDRLVTPPRSVRLRRDCESVQTDAITVGQPRRNGTALTFFISPRVPEACRMRLTVRGLDGRLLAAAARRLRDTSTSITARLTAAGQRRLQRRTPPLRIQTRRSNCSRESRYRYGPGWTLLPRQAR
jgi:hypothetical protein